MNFLETRTNSEEEPFFLYFSHFAVHSPYKGKEDEISHFEGKPTKGWNGHRNPVYASMIKSLDRSVGQILKKLEVTRLEENTLVIFMSDNGGIDSKITPRGDGTDNRPFLGGKATLNEGGIRVPLIFRWKGKMEGDLWVNVPVDCTDIYPTILDAAKLNVGDSDISLDGQSLLPLLSDTENKQEIYTKKTRYWHYPFNVIYNSPYDGYPLTAHSAIRDGDYKLIFDWYGRLYLYNIEKDPYEKSNLSETMPQLTQDLFGKLKQWLQREVDQRYWPSLNADYNAKEEVRNTPFTDLIFK